MRLVESHYCNKNPPTLLYSSSEVTDDFFLNIVRKSKKHRVTTRHRVLRICVRCFLTSLILTHSQSDRWLRWHKHRCGCSQRPTVDVHVASRDSVESDANVVDVDATDNAPVAYRCKQS